jgi:ABC-type multidrug transport system fused ATPase/permease subunit
MVTHQVARLRQADRILVLDRGRIAQLGTHAELCHIAGPYSELLRMSARDSQELRALAPEERAG